MFTLEQIEKTVKQKGYVWFEDMSKMNVQKKILEDQKKKIQTIQKEIKEIKRLERTTSNIMDEFENYDPIDPNCCDTSQH